MESRRRKPPTRRISKRRISNQWMSKRQISSRRTSNRRKSKRQISKRQSENRIGLRQRGPTIEWSNTRSNVVPPHGAFRPVRHPQTTDSGSTRCAAFSEPLRFTRIRVKESKEPQARAWGSRAARWTRERSQYLLPGPHAPGPHRKFKPTLKTSFVSLRSTGNAVPRPTTQAAGPQMKLSELLPNP